MRDAKSHCLNRDNAAPSGHDDCGRHARARIVSNAPLAVANDERAALDGNARAIIFRRDDARFDLKPGFPKGVAFRIGPRVGYGSFALARVWGCRERRLSGSQHRLPRRSCVRPRGCLGVSAIDGRAWLAGRKPRQRRGKVNRVTARFAQTASSSIRPSRSAVLRSKRFGFKAMAKSGPRHLGLMRQGLASAFAHGLRPGRASRAEPPGLASPLRVDGLDRVGPYPCRRSSEGRSAASLAPPAPSPMAPWPQRGRRASQRPASALDRAAPWTSAASPVSPVERRPVSGFPCPGKAASQPAPALASLAQAPQRPHGELVEPRPWLHGPQPRPSHRQSPSAPPIDPPSGLALSPQAHINQAIQVIAKYS